MILRKVEMGGVNNISMMLRYFLFCDKYRRKLNECSHLDRRGFSILAANHDVSVHLYTCMIFLPGAAGTGL